MSQQTSDLGSGVLTPQQALNRLQQAAGRPLTPQEIEQAKTMLPAGWEQGIQESALGPLLTQASALMTAGAAQPGGGILTGGSGSPEYTVTNTGTVYPGSGGGTTQAPPLTGGPDERIFIDKKTPGGPASPPGGGGPFPEFTPPTYTAPNPYAPGQYTAPQYQSGGPFVAPGPFSYQPFEYEQFQAPSLEEAKNEPGYQFAMDQGRKALENSAAAKGTLRTGGTLKDLFSWGEQFGEQNYGNVFNRKAQTHDTNRSGAFTSWAANRDNAADAWSKNYGVSKDTFGINDKQNTDSYDRNALAGLTQFQTNQGAGERAHATNTGNALDAYDRNYQGAVAAFNPKFESAKLSFEDLYRRWRDKLNATTSVATAGAY